VLQNSNTSHTTTRAKKKVENIILKWCILKWCIILHILINSHDFVSFNVKLILVVGSQFIHNDIYARFTKIQK